MLESLARLKLHTNTALKRMDSETLLALNSVNPILTAGRAASPCFHLLWINTY